MLIDQFTFFKIMKMATNYNYTTLSDLYAMFAVNSINLIMITVSLVIGISHYRCANVIRKL